MSFIYTPPAPVASPVPAAIPAPQVPTGIFDPGGADTGTLDVYCFEGGKALIAGSGGIHEIEIPKYRNQGVPVTDLRPGSYRVIMRYEDGHMEEKTVDVETSKTTHLGFFYTMYRGPEILFTDPIINTTAGWSFGTEHYTTATSRANVIKEVIEGKERDVLDMEITFLQANTGWAWISTNNYTTMQKFREGSRLRFKVLGDGRSWQIEFTNYNAGVRTYHVVPIATRRNRVVEVTIPYTRFPSSNGRRFNKEWISVVSFNRPSNDRTGTSTLKIFDFEIIP